MLSLRVDAQILCSRAFMYKRATLLLLSLVIFSARIPFSNPLKFPSATMMFGSVALAACVAASALVGSVVEARPPRNYSVEYTALEFASNPGKCAGLPANETQVQLVDCCDDSVLQGVHPHARTRSHAPTQMCSPRPHTPLSPQPTRTRAPFRCMSSFSIAAELYNAVSPHM